jgi:hypothetical protein
MAARLPNDRIAVKIRLLSFALKWSLRFASLFAHALGRSLPGPLPVFVPPKVDPVDLPDNDYLNREQVLAAHAQFGQLDRDKVKLGMGPNWPSEWDTLGDDSIFTPRLELYGCTRWR